MHKKIIIANWKMNKNFDYLEKFYENINVESIKLIILPPLISLAIINEKFLRNELKTKNNIFFGSQNFNEHNEGSFTGEISLGMFNDLKFVDYMMLGHSETRINFTNDNEVISHKIKAILENSDLKPIIVFGENRKIINLNELITFLINQLRDYFKSSNISLFSKRDIIFAYEPSWSVGTGAFHDIETLNMIYSKLSEYILKNFGFSNFNLIYGGSVNESNYSNFINTNFDGFLLGYPSTKVEFIKKMEDSYE